jgi:hypothetical protein
VECYSGSRYAERPRAFYYEDRRWQVVDVLRTEQHPGRRLFTVRTLEGDLFNLIYDEAFDRWRIERSSQM